MPSVSIGAAAGAAGLVGAGTSAYGAYKSGQANAASAMYQSQVAANNALIAKQNISLTQAAGDAQEAALGMKTSASVGAMKAAQGASGVDVNTGSNANVRLAAGKLGALDMLTTRSNTARAAYGYEVAEESDTAESELLQSEASQAKTAGDISALGTFLSGASSVGAKYAPLQLGANSPGTSGFSVPGLV